MIESNSGLLISRRNVLLSATAGALTLLSGCQTTTVQSPRPVVATAAGAPAFTGNAIQAIDPCGDRMEDLCGPLVFYYRENHHGPEQLQELEKYAIPGQQLIFTCPVSGRPYLCAPQGLAADGIDIRIYVFDDAPVHEGARWCAVKKGGSPANGAEIMFAVKIKEEDFQKFRAAPMLLPIQ